MTSEELSLAQDKIEAEQECRNLMGKTSLLLGENSTMKFVDLWAKRGDCTLAMPWGCYDGYEGVKRCYTVDHKDIGNESAFETLKGFWYFDQISTGYIEVADDLQTARATFQSWKSVTNPSYNEKYEYSRNSYYVWGKFAVDFIFEDGVWKFWHMRFYLLFKAIYGAGRINDLPYRGFELREITCDRPTLPAYSWSPEAIYPADEPALPEPYTTFADVAPGYGYTID